MPQMKCPSCGRKGEARGTEESFAIRGRDSNSEYGWPIRKCLACGAGMTVKPRPFPPGLKPTLIDSKRWKEMENAWEREFDSKSES